MELNKDRLRVIRAAIDAALSTVAKDLKLEKLTTGSCTYDRDGSFSFRVEGVDAGGLSKDAKRYKEFVELFDRDAQLPLPALGWEFINGAQRLKVAGMNSTGSKVLAQDLGTDKQYWYKTDSLRTIYARQRNAARSLPARNELERASGRRVGE